MGLLLVAVAVALARASAADVAPDVVLKLDGVNVFGARELYAVSSPSFYPSADSIPTSAAAASPVQILVADPPTGCVSMAGGGAAPSAPFVLLVARGVCSFGTKVALAQAAGAAAVIVYGTPLALYANGSYIQDPCAVDCSLGASYLAPALPTPGEIAAGFPSTPCAAAPACASRACALTGERDSASGAQRVCCILDDYTVGAPRKATGVGSPARQLGSVPPRVRGGRLRGVCVRLTTASLTRRPLSAAGHGRRRQPLRCECLAGHPSRVYQHRQWVGAAPSCQCQRRVHAASHHPPAHGDPLREGAAF